MTINKKPLYRLWLFFSLLLTSACTTLPQNSGHEDIEALVQNRGFHVEKTNDINSQVDAYLNNALTVENAIRIALINNPRLRAEYARLGFSVADIYEAGRIRNPVFSASLLQPNRGGEQDRLSFGLITSFTDLITRSARKHLATQQFVKMKQSIAANAIKTAMATESAFYEFVAAKQILTLQKHIAKVGKLSTDLAQRYRDAGNLTARELAMSATHTSQRRLNALDAEALAYDKRALLATQMGVPVNNDWDAPAQLPLPLAQEDTLEQLLDLALHSHLDLTAAQTQTKILADKLGIENWTRWLSELNIGIEHERETDGARLTGPNLEWELPVFNQQQDVLLRTKTAFQISLIEVNRLQLAISNNVHLSYGALTNARARIKEHRDHLLPAHVTTVARSQEEENFMLIGIFELLATKQQEYESYQSYLESVRDYWLARSRLAQAVGNRLPSNAFIGNDVLDIDSLLQTKAPTMMHAPAHAMEHQKESIMPEAPQNIHQHSNHPDTRDGGAQ